MSNVFSRPSELKISLGDLTAAVGDVPTVFRCTQEDKDDIDSAAKSLHMSSAQFMRMIVVQAARKILSAQGIVT